MSRERKGLARWARPAALLLVAVALLQGESVVPEPARAAEDAGFSSPYGVNAHLPNLFELDLQARLGARWARVDFTWDLLERRQGEYRWDITDPIVEQAEERGIELLPILGYCPRWASSGPDNHYPPKRTKDWQAFVSAIVGRYRGRIRVWSLWNEPNSETFFHGTPESFVNLILFPGAQAAKETDPDCLVAGPDLAHLKGAQWDTWLDRLLELAAPRLDIITHHCYQDKPSEVFRKLDGKSYPWEPKPVIEILKRRGQIGKPFWLTEVGWRSTKIGEGRQASYLKETLAGVAARPWIHKVFLFELRDSPGLEGYGLLRLNGSKKESFPTVRQFIRNHPIRRP